MPEELNADPIARLYAAFAQCDGDGMAACYATDASFSDPVFPGLHGPEVGAMWRMLTSRATDLKVELVEHEASADAGSASWVANYTFADTGRLVENRVKATFELSEGLIKTHRDDFDFHRWSRQALGTSGLLLGWTPLLRGAVRRRAGGRLTEFIAADQGKPRG